MDKNIRRIGVFGGAFNPPHNGHVAAVKTAIRCLGLDKLYVIPTGTSPHKTPEDGSPDGVDRYRMAQLAFCDMDKADVLDIELNRSGPSYTSDTLKEIHDKHSDAVLFLILGADMFLTIQKWHCPEEILELSTVCALCRESGQLSELIKQKEYLMERFGAASIVLENQAIELSSTEVRDEIRIQNGTNLVPPKVLEYILENNLYAKANGITQNPVIIRDINSFRDTIGEETYQKALSHISLSRRSHVEGCISEAIRLSNHWGVDSLQAATSALYHDITKSHNLEEQLNLLRKYGIIPRTIDKESFATLHPITGAVVAREIYGVDKDIESAIRYHTTGRADMTSLEAILYLADYIEPSRDFRGVAEVRHFAYRDLDFALMIALRNTIEMVCRSCRPLNPDTVEAYNFYLSQCIRKPI